MRLIIRNDTPTLMAKCVGSSALSESSAEGSSLTWAIPEEEFGRASLDIFLAPKVETT